MLPGFGRSALGLALFGLSLLPLAACGSDDDSPSGGGSTPGVCAAVPAPQKPAASCDVTIQSPPVITNVRHVPEGSQITYCSNPPTSGDHYAVWADFKEYDAPIAWPYLVHSMEHGAVLLLYKCDGAPCPEIVDALRRVRDAAAVDPLCDAETQKRIIIAPATTTESKVAAAAWDATYAAPCVDAPTLEAFVRDHYAKGPENFCNPGKPTF